MKFTLEQLLALNNELTGHVDAIRLTAALPVAAAAASQPSEDEAVLMKDSGLADPAPLVPRHDAPHYLLLLRQAAVLRLIELMQARGWKEIDMSNPQALPGADKMWVNAFLSLTGIDREGMPESPEWFDGESVENIALLRIALEGAVSAELPAAVALMSASDSAAETDGVKRFSNPIGEAREGAASAAVAADTAAVDEESPDPALAKVIEPAHKALTDTVSTLDDWKKKVQGLHTRVLKAESDSSIALVTDWGSTQGQPSFGARLFSCAPAKRYDSAGWVGVTATVFLLLMTVGLIMLYAPNLFGGAFASDEHNAADYLGRLMNTPGGALIALIFGSLVTGLGAAAASQPCRQVEEPAGPKP